MVRDGGWEWDYHAPASIPIKGGDLDGIPSYADAVAWAGLPVYRTCNRCWVPLRSLVMDHLGKRKD